MQRVPGEILRVVRELDGAEVLMGRGLGGIAPPDDAESLHFGLGQQLAGVTLRREGQEERDGGDHCWKDLFFSVGALKRLDEQQMKRRSTYLRVLGRLRILYLLAALWCSDLSVTQYIGLHVVAMLQCKRWPNFDMNSIDVPHSHALCA